MKRPKFKMFEKVYVANKQEYVRPLLRAIMGVKLICTRNDEVVHGYYVTHPDFPERLDREVPGLYMYIDHPEFVSEDVLFRTYEEAAEKFVEYERSEILRLQKEIKEVLECVS